MAWHGSVHVCHLCLSVPCVAQTWGVQIMPTVAVVAWSGADCHTATATAEESSLEDCVPFADRGPLVFTLGFLLTACLFLPFGRYQLKVSLHVARLFHVLFNPLPHLSFFCCRY